MQLIVDSVDVADEHEEHGRPRARGDELYVLSYGIIIYRDHPTTGVRVITADVARGFKDNVGRTRTGSTALVDQPTTLIQIEEESLSNSAAIAHLVILFDNDSYRSSIVDEIHDAARDALEQAINDKNLIELINLGSDEGAQELEEDVKNSIFDKVLPLMARRLFVPQLRPDDILGFALQVQMTFGETPKNRLWSEQLFYEGGRPRRREGPGMYVVSGRMQVEVTGRLDVLPSIAATSWADGRFDVFGYYPPGEIFQAWSEGNWRVSRLEGPPPTVGAGGMRHEPTAASWGPNRYDLFTIGRNGRLIQFWHNNGWRWSELMRPNPGSRSSAIGRVTATSWGEGRYDVFGVGTNNHVWQVYFEDGSWRTADLGEPQLPNTTLVAGSLSATSWGPGRIDVFGLSTDGRVIQLWYDGGWNWSDRGTPPDVDSVDNIVGKQLSATSWGEGRIDIFLVARRFGATNQLIQLWYQGGWTWSNQGEPPTAMGAIGGPVSAVCPRSEKINVYCLSTNDSRLIEYRYDEGWEWMIDI